MAMFSYLYYNSYVGAEVGVTVGSVLSSAVQLSRKQQLELWGLLANLLAGIHLPGLPPVPFNEIVIFNTEIWEALANFQQENFDACRNLGGIPYPVSDSHSWSPIVQRPTHVAYTHIHQCFSSQLGK